MISGGEIVLYIDKYKHLIKEKPYVASEIENALRLISWLISGRFKYSNVASELIYSASTVLQLAHDIFLRQAHSIKVNISESVDKLKIYITLIEYVQVFLEITAKTLVGEAGKWFMITLVQTVKAAIKLMLVFYYGEGVGRQIPYQPVDRVRDVPRDGCIPPTRDIVAPNPENSHKPSDDTKVKLKRSGRLIRTLDHAPPRSKRTWNLSDDPLSIIKMMGKEGPPTPLNDSQKLGEILHILRPLAHLTTMSKFGQDAWTPYLLSFGMDITSLHLMGDTRGRTFTASERAEIAHRSLSLFMYLMRSPFYDSFTKKRILAILRTLADRIPIFGSLIRPYILYLPEWQKTYFYVWNS